MAEEGDGATVLNPSGTNQGTTAILGGKYRIEREIGQGAFGRVYLAFDPRLRRNVAIKELLSARDKTDRTTYERYLDRFEREARAAGGLEHPNIVAVHELAVDAEGNYYLVMQYVDGTDLQDLLSTVKSLPVERAVALTLEIAQALDTVHEHDIVHRDLKPANIMLTRRGTAKLTDFGIAQVGTESQRTQVVSGHPGTPMYMSPEQSSGTGYLDGRSDLYSLGLVLYEMLAGEPYARRRRPLATARPELSSQIVNITNKLMEPNLDARYQNASDVIADLRQLSLLPTTATLPAVSPTTEEERTRVGGPVSQPAPVWNPVPGVPSAYGGAGTQSQPGAPAFGTVAPPPPGPGTSDPYVPGFAGTGGPPVYPGTPVGPPQYGAPPPVKSKRGLWLGIAGGAAVLIAAILIGVFATKGGSGTSTATTAPRPTGTTVAAASTPTSGTGASIATTAPTPAPSATSTSAATTPPAVTPTGGATTAATGALTTWSDKNGLVKLQYPAAWNAVNDQKYALQIESTTDGTLFVDIFDQTGTPDDDLASYRDIHSKSTTYNYADGPPTDAQIGNRAGRYMFYTYTPKDKPTETHNGAIWVVNNGGKTFEFRSSDYGTHRDDYETIIKGVTFTAPASSSAPQPTAATAASKPTATPAAALATWTDRTGTVRLQYPNSWAAKEDNSDPNQILILDGGPKIGFDVYAANPTGTIDSRLLFLKAAGLSSKSNDYEYDAPVDVTIAGQPGKSMTYRYRPKNQPDAKQGVGTVWIVDHNGKRYEFTGSNIAVAADEINGVISTIKFLK